MTQDAALSVQADEFKSVSTILADAEALIAQGEYQNAVSRIGHALAAGLARLDIQAARDNQLEISARMKTIAGLNGYVYQLTQKALPEAMNVAVFYKQNKPYKVDE